MSHLRSSFREPYLDVEPQIHAVRVKFRILVSSQQIVRLPFVLKLPSWMTCHPPFHPPSINLPLKLELYILHHLSTYPPSHDFGSASSHSIMKDLVRISVIFNSYILPQSRSLSPIKSSQKKEKKTQQPKRECRSASTHNLLSYSPKGVFYLSIQHLHLLRPHYTYTVFLRR